MFFSFNIAYAKTIIINEIAWMGTETSSNDEWLELFNTTNENISLDNYTLMINDKEIKLEGTIKAKNFFILERTNDETLSNTKADLIYTGAMKNTGGVILLKDNQNNLIDEVNFKDGWTYGDNSTKQTMERIEDNWQTSMNPNGSPKEINIENKIEIAPKEESIEIKKESNVFPFYEMIGFSFISAIALALTRKQLKRTA